MAEMLTRKCKEKIDILYKAEGFDNQFEKTKKTGLELILSVQSFRIEPSKKKLSLVQEKVADYWILCKQILRNAKKAELKHLVQLNNSFENTMKDLELKETYSNILKKYENDISSKLRERISSLSLTFQGNPYKLGII